MHVRGSPELWRMVDRSRNEPVTWLTYQCPCCAENISFLPVQDANRCGNCGTVVTR